MFGFDSINALFGLALRILAAVIAGVLVWYISIPIVVGLYRLAFHRKSPQWFTFSGRVVLSCIAAVIAFLLIGFMGLGGGGKGDGPGKGSGNGKKGVVSPNDSNDTQTNVEKKKESTKPVPKVVVEIVPRDLYFEKPEWKDKFRYYWFEEKARSYSELEPLLEKYRDKEIKIYYRIWKNSFNEEHSSVSNLRDLIRALHCTPIIDDFTDKINNEFR